LGHLRKQSIRDILFPPSFPFSAIAIYHLELHIGQFEHLYPEQPAPVCQADKQYPQPLCQHHETEKHLAINPTREAPWDASHESLPPISVIPRRCSSSLSRSSWTAQLRYARRPLRFTSSGPTVRVKVYLICISELTGHPHASVPDLITQGMFSTLQVGIR
jgi:hypothetical protein